jgi:hypothetical protein
VGFRFSLLIPTVLLGPVDLDRVKDHLSESMKDWYIEWMGIE